MTPLCKLPFRPLLLLVQLLTSISIVSAGYAFNKPQVRLTTTFADFNARIMDQWGKGGGKFVKIWGTARHPFQGRIFGGGKRKEIRGSRAFGSGYPYGVGDPSTITGRPFPFGTWPLWWDQQYMGSDEYGPHLDATRPGGFVVLVPLRRMTTTKAEYASVMDDEVYYAIGDRDSVLPMMVSYVTGCHVVPAWPVKFDPRMLSSPVKLENVIQYFRASSFALASPAYNNTFARNAGTVSSPTSTSTPVSSNDDDNASGSPLPDIIERSPFRRCVDDATYHALAIVNKPPGQTALDRFVVALMGMPIVFGFVLFWVLYLLRHAISEVRLWVWEYLFPERMDRRRAARDGQFAYENYP